MWEPWRRRYCLMLFVVLASLAGLEGGAKADLLTLTIPDSSVSIAPGTGIVFDGTIANTTGVDIADFSLSFANFDSSVVSLSQSNQVSNLQLANGADSGLI